MEEMANLILNYGVSAIIVVLFIWDWVTNKQTITQTLKTIATASDNITKCLKNLEKNDNDLSKYIEQNNTNISKSLDLLQKSMDEHDRKLDKLLNKKGDEK